VPFRKAIVIGAALCLAATAASAQDLNGFLREKGAGDVAISVTSESYDHFWAGDTKVSDPGVGEVDTQTASIWMAYGLSNRWTLIATLPYVDTDGDGTGGFSESGIQDFAVLGAVQLAQFGNGGSSRLVGAVGARTPASDYEGNLPVSIGDDTTDWLARLVYQFQHKSFYISQQIGYDLRGGDAPDGWPLYTEIGYTHGRTTYNVFLSKLIADGGTDIGDPGFTFPSNKEEYERTGAKAYIRINDRFGIAVSAFTTLDGRNTGDSSGASIGANFGF